jgi:hypothetical protein
MSLPLADLSCENVTLLDASGAQRLLEAVGAQLQVLRRRKLVYKILLGQVLRHIDDRELWRAIHGGYSSWLDFLRHGFPLLSGLQCRSAYDALELAQSQVVSRLPRKELEKIASLANVRHLAFLERSGRKVTQDVIRNAQRHGIVAFRRLTGFGPIAPRGGFNVKIRVAEEGKARQLQRVLQVLSAGSPEQLDALTRFLQDERLGASVDDRIYRAVEVLKRMPGPAAGGLALAG